MKFKKIPYPSLTEAISKARKHPQKAGVIAIEYLVNCVYIEEADRLRAEADKNQVENREDYIRNGYLSFNQKTAIGTCRITYPRLRGFNVKKVVSEIDASFLEQLKKDITAIYVSGDSDRDIAHDLEAAGIELSRTSASRYYRQEQENAFEAFRQMDLKESSFLCLRVDSMYTKARVSTTLVPKYEEVALARVIGLDTKTRCFKCLALQPFPSESITGYEILFDILLDQNIGEVFLVNTDFHHAFISASQSSFIGAQTQKCKFYFQQITVRSAQDSFSREQAVDLFREAHDQEYNQQQSREHFESLIPKVEENDPALAKKLKKNFESTLAYKVYPKAFYKDISTTNQDERSNEETRRRDDPIHASPSINSDVELAFAVTMKEQQKWSKDPKGTTAEIIKAIDIHYKMLEALYSDALTVMKRFPEFTSEDFEETNFPALWVNLFIVPVRTQDNVMTLGFLAAHSIRVDKSIKLLSLTPIRDNSRDAYLECADRLVSRGLNKDCLKLIVSNRPNRKIQDAFDTVFEESNPFMDPSLFLKRLLYLTWDEGMKLIVKALFERIYTASDYQTAREYLKQFREILVAGKLEPALEYFDRFGGDNLISVFNLVDQKIWAEIGLKDFELKNNWKNKCTQLRNQALDMTQTVRGLKNSLKRKATTHKPSD